MLLEQANKPKQIISITPLIDVVFILLLFFMLSSSFDRTRQIELNAAAAGAQDASVAEPRRIVMLSAEQVAIDGETYVLAGAVFRNQLHKIAGAEQPVFLAATPEVRIQPLIQLVERMHQAGIHNLKLSASVSP